MKKELPKDNIEFSIRLRQTAEIERKRDVDTLALLRIVDLLLHHPGRGRPMANDKITEITTFIK